jgi:S1-C subfamily serine protease
MTFARSFQQCLALPLIASLIFVVSPQAIAQTLSDESVLDSVFLVGIAKADGSFQEVGTAWTIAPHTLATNAHVAEGLTDNLEEGDRMIARHGLLDRSEVVLGNVHIHPAYVSWNPRLGRMFVGAASQLKQFEVISVADIAILEVTAGDAGTPLPVADMSDPNNKPALGDEVMYLGYPAENLSGFTTLHTVKCNVTARTDFFFTRTDWDDSLLMHLSGPVTGGASGSPVLDSQGRVIAVLSAAEHIAIETGVRASFGFAYAQRVDLAVEMIDGTLDRRQANRDDAWSRRAYDLFTKPDDIISELVGLHAESASVNAGAIDTVTTRRESLSPDVNSRRTRYVLDPGYTYGFIAVAHDASDIDSSLENAAGDIMNFDQALDQFPVLWIEPQTQRAETFLNINAGEPLLRDTDITVRVVRYPRSAAVPTEEVVGEVIFEEDYITTRDGPYTNSWTITATADMTYTCEANALNESDIDLVLSDGEEILAQDILINWYPVVKAGGRETKYNLELRIPDGMVAGETVQMRILEAPVE